MNALIDNHRVVLGQHNTATDSWTVNYWVRSTSEQKPKTVWWETRHDAGTHGTTLLNTFLGSRGAFSFPKSVYAVRDTLATVVRDRPNALIVDFFAGSGTTLHATWMLNQEDGGARRCVLVTNNEVADKVANRLMRDKENPHFRGDPEFEANGVFELAARPRLEAALTGLRPDGTAIPGNYVSGRPYSGGYDENVEFFRLDYLDPVLVELGRCFEALHPSMWLRAGGVGERESLDTVGRFAIAPNSPYAVLFDPSGMPGLLDGLAARHDIAYVFIVTDTDHAYADLASALPHGIIAVQLYRSYLDNVRAAIA
jgi:adenine-specific DNA-methyltransferase